MSFPGKNTTKKYETKQLYRYYYYTGNHIRGVYCNNINNNNICIITAPKMMSYRTSVYLQVIYYNIILIFPKYLYIYRINSIYYIRSELQCRLNKILNDIVMIYILLYRDLPIYIYYYTESISAVKFFQLTAAGKTSLHRRRRRRLRRQCVFGNARVCTSVVTKWPPPPLGSIYFSPHTHTHTYSRAYTYYNTAHTHIPTQAHS